MGCLRHRYTRAILRFTFSQAGLCIVVTLYAILGALMFQAIERSDSAELDTRVHKVNVLEKLKNETIMELKALWNQWNGKELNVTMVKVQEIIDFHRREVASELENYDGGLYLSSQEAGVTIYAPPTLEELVTSRDADWSLASAILFTATILTTIGYGHVYPKTMMGMIAVICYALFAIPIMTMWLSAIGFLFADGVQWLTMKCVRKRKINAGGDRPGPAWDTERVDEPDETSHVCQAAVSCGIAVLMTTLYIIMGMIIFWQWEGWGITSSGYFVFISLTVIGFGDYVPGVHKAGIEGQMELLVLGLYLLLGLAMLSMTFALIFGLVEEIGKVTRKRVEEKLQETRQRRRG